MYKKFVHNSYFFLRLFLSVAVLNISIDTVNFTPFHQDTIANSFNEYNSIVEYLSETITGNHLLINDQHKLPSSNAHRAKAQSSFWAIPLVQMVPLIVNPINHNYICLLNVNEYDNIDLQINIPPPKSA